jgi:hypothetical protein
MAKAHIAFGKVSKKIQAENSILNLKETNLSNPDMN